MSGIIDTSKLKVLPERHELETAKYFADLGYDIVFLPPNNSPKMSNPDILMNGVVWEMKCPKGKSKRTIENNIRKANKQSENIIFDLRRINLEESTSIRRLEKEFNIRPHLKRLLVIKKNGELLKYT